MPLACDLFTGLDLPADVVGNLERPDRAPPRLRRPGRIQWSPPANLHITTKFIGEWPEDRLGELKAALAALPPRPPIAVHVRELGFFPNPRSPRVFWCGIDAPGLAELAADTDRATAALGIAAENRAYSPHLTLARIKERIDLAAAPATPSPPCPRSISAASKRRAFFLYRSQLRPTGSVYTKLAEFPLSSDDPSSRACRSPTCWARFPFGYLLVKWKTGADVRAAGSGNIGATNVLRTTGARRRRRHPAARYRQRLPGRLDRRPASPTTVSLWMCVAALAVMAGHAYPVFLRSKAAKRSPVSWARSSA